MKEWVGSLASVHAGNNEALVAAKDVAVTCQWQIHYLTGRGPDRFLLQQS